MHEMFTRDGRELSLDTVIYDRSKKKGQTMIDTIDRAAALMTRTCASSSSTFWGEDGKDREH